MTYCIYCEKLTNDNIQYEFTEDFSSHLQLVIVSCEECNTFKYQYLNPIDNNNVSEL